MLTSLRKRKNMGVQFTDLRSEFEIWRGVVTDWMLALEYEQEVAEKSREDYDPYSHVYEGESFSDVDIPEEWEWEEE
jgi:hypothetical protein